MNESRHIEAQPRNNSETDAASTSTSHEVLDRRDPLARMPLCSKAMDALDEDLRDLPDDLEEHLFQIAEVMHELDAEEMPHQWADAALDVVGHGYHRAAVMEQLHGFFYQLALDMDMGSAPEPHCFFCHWTTNVDTIFSFACHNSVSRYEFKPTKSTSQHVDKGISLYFGRPRFSTISALEPEIVVWDSQHSSPRQEPKETWEPTARLDEEILLGLKPASSRGIFGSQRMVRAGPSVVSISWPGSNLGLTTELSFKQRNTYQCSPPGTGQSCADSAFLLQLTRFLLLLREQA